MPSAIVLARVRGWFFMNSRGTERPMTITTRIPVTICKGSLNLLENIGLLRMSRTAIFGSRDALFKPDSVEVIYGVEQWLWVIEESQVS